MGDRIGNKHRFIVYRRNFKPALVETLDPQDINHLKSLRIFNKDKLVEVRDGEGNFYLYQSSANEKKIAYIDETGSYPNPDSIRVGGAIPKGSRLDWLLQKGAEIGVTEFHFCNFERSVRSDFSEERADRILIEASHQSLRTHLPKIFTYPSWKKLVSAFHPEHFLFLDPGSERPLSTEDTKDKILLIGPEGGLGEDREDLLAMGISGRNLGKEVLRMETAYLYSAILQKQAILENVRKG